ncbi:hypothetical protein MpV1_047c [Micromonas sp. RCC1109 virus MpV1]|uniref:hypothetical protein n=1 Tax=Micromonas sp. RCC1109 virus MpV1 TaxID=880161 RepID=UPI0001EF444B|nr:hypothetical protein MpV1_047c [Micromonas sp. RCC1109 virus MpV1]ADQ90970.1 hypothetical protein MpV1_047c [Micromonas sp. RCC1109 virus MpV1]
MRFVPSLEALSIQSSYKLSFGTHMVVTGDDGSFRHITRHRTVFHGWQFKQIGPSYTKSHFVHSLRMLILRFDVSPLANRSSSFTVYIPYLTITSSEGNRILF